MKRFPSIKKNSDFQNIYRNGKSYANRLLVMYVMRNGEESNRLGISVSKKVGNSVVRHHIARLMREIFRVKHHRCGKNCRSSIRSQTFGRCLYAPVRTASYFKRIEVKLEMKIIKKTMIVMIRGYQKYLSPLKRYTHCIYTPTCSQYAIEALEKYGVFKGTWLACKRILRCHPFAEGGYDPVP